MRCVLCRVVTIVHWRRLRSSAAKSGSQSCSVGSDERSDIRSSLMFVAISAPLVSCCHRFWCIAIIASIALLPTVVICLFWAIVSIDCFQSTSVNKVGLNRQIQVWLIVRFRCEFRLCAQLCNCYVPSQHCWALAHLSLGSLTNRIQGKSYYYESQSTSVSAIITGLNISTKETIYANNRHLIST